MDKGVPLSIYANKHRKCVITFTPLAKVNFGVILFYIMSIFCPFFFICKKNRKNVYKKNKILKKFVKNTELSFTLNKKYGKNYQIKKKKYRIKFIKYLLS